MGKPAARIGDFHVCPVTTPEPHVGGKIIGQGATSVLIEGQYAALLGDECSCSGPPDVIITASCGVYIQGRPAARLGDLCAHGGKIIEGCDSVLIGGVWLGDAESELCDYICLEAFVKSSADTEKKFHLPPPAKRYIIINLAIYDATALLRKKLKLLRKGDAITIEEFVKWFGSMDHLSKVTIVQRIKRELRLMKKLNYSHFRTIANKEFRKTQCAHIMKNDRTHTIFLGDFFWGAARFGKDSKCGILIHEISHYPHIGKTDDHAYEEDGCLSLAVKEPEKALYNADSFEFFIES